jgi:glycine/D-amino acid oxidase-like deaminating enzyme
MQTTNFWAEDYPRPADLPTAELPEQVDVLIVGGGYTGLHAALALCKAGATVAVLDQETIGWGASSRNGGMALTGMKMEMPAIFKRYGPDLGRRFWEWSLASLDHLECTLVEEGIDCDYERSGHLLLAAKPQHFAAMAHEAAWMRQTLGYEQTWLVDKVQQRAEIGTSEFHGGLGDRRSGGLHPAKYVFGLAQAAARRGALLVEHTQVTGIARPGERQGPAGGNRAAKGSQTQFAVGTSRGMVLAREILVATNGYTSNALPALRRGIFPVGSYIIVTEPLAPALQAELSPHRRMFFDSKNFLNYFRLTPDGRMLFGGRHNLATGLDLGESARLMRRRMVEVFPQLAGVMVTHTWTGKLGVAFDLMPHAGRVEGIHYAYGYAGHGVSIAGHLGKEVGEIIAGQRGSTPFAEISHPRFPFTRYDKLYLPLVSKWFQAVDKFK